MKQRKGRGIKEMKIKHKTLKQMMAFSLSAFLILPPFSIKVDAISDTTNEQVNRDDSVDHVGKQLNETQTTNNAGNFNVSGNASGWEYEEDIPQDIHTIRFFQSGTYEITGYEKIGFSNIEIAADIKVALKLTKFHIESIVDKPVIYVGENTDFTLLVDGANYIRNGRDLRQGIVAANNAVLRISGLSDDANLKVGGGGTKTVYSAINAPGVPLYINDCDVTLMAGDGAISLFSLGKIIAQNSNVTCNYSWYTTAASVADELFIKNGTFLANIAIVTKNGEKLSFCYYKPVVAYTAVEIDGVNHFPDDRGSYLGNINFALTQENHVMKIDDRTVNIIWDQDSFIHKFEEEVTPTVSLQSKTFTSISVKPLDSQEIYGTALYKLEQNGQLIHDWGESNTFENLLPYTTYKVYAKHKGNKNYKESNVSTIQVNTLKDGNVVISEPTGLAAYYSDKLESVSLSSFSNWSWKNKDTTIDDIGIQSYVAQFSTLPLEEEYDFSTVSGYDPIHHVVERSIDINVSKATNKWLSNVSIQGWKYGQKANAPTATAKCGVIKYTYSDTETSGFTSNVPNKVGTWYVKASIEDTDKYTGLESIASFVIAKGDSTIAISPDDMNKEFDGKQIENPVVNKSGSAKDVVFTWYQKKGDSWTKLDAAPSTFGDYKVVVSVADDDNYNGATVEKMFSITKSTNAWTTSLTIADWTYNEPANKPFAVSKYGVVKYTYSNAANGVYTEVVPSTAGTWYVKASVAETSEYMGLVSAPISFKIEKAMPNYEIPTHLSATYAQQLKEISLPEGFSWMDENALVGNVGVNHAKIRFTPSDLKNYKIMEDIVVSFHVNKALNVWNTQLKIENWKYAQTPNTPQAQAKFGSVEFRYSDAKDGIFNSNLPSAVGTWYVKASVLGNENYNGLEAIVAFSIEKADTILSIDSTLDKIYDGEEISVPIVTKVGSSKDMVFDWYRKEGARWVAVEETPSSVGEYKLVVRVDADENYHAAIAEKQFGINYPSVSEKNDTIYRLNSGKDLVITCSGALENLLGIYLNGQLVDSKYYLLQSGSTILTMKASFLETLKSGAHTLTFVYKNNIKVDVTIRVDHAENKPIYPETGDTTNITWYFSLIVLSGLFMFRRFASKK